MSAIIAGESCKKCGNKYFVSLGHPPWFDDVVKKRKPPCEIYKRYLRIAQSGKCPTCITGVIEFHACAIALIRRITYGRKIKRRRL